MVLRLSRDLELAPLFLDIGVLEADLVREREEIAVFLHESHEPFPPYAFDACRSAIWRMAIIIAALPRVLTSVGCAAYSALILSTMPASCCSTCWAKVRTA